MLQNRWHEMAAPSAGLSLRDALRSRFHTLVDVGGLDEPRARDWTVVRMVVDASWAVQDARRTGRAVTLEERERITRCLTIVKAVQD